MNYVYVLSDEELALVDRLTIAMREYADRPSATYMGDPDEKERAGFAGEIATAGMWDLPFDAERRVNGKGDGGVDYVIYLRGWPVPIDVKTRAGKYTDLLVKKSVIDLGNIAHVYMCAHFAGRTVRFIGWQVLRHVMHAPVETFGGGTPCYWCERRLLLPMQSLDRIIRCRDGVAQCA